MHRPILEDGQVERLIGLSIIAALFLACLKITAPFIGPCLWAIIIAVSIWPAYLRLLRRTRSRRLTVVVVVAALMLGFFAPLAVLAASLAENTEAIGGLIEDMADIRLPAAPPHWVRWIPLADRWILGHWDEWASDAAALDQKLRPYIDRLTEWGLARGANLAVALLQFFLALIFTGFLVAHGETLQRGLRAFVQRVGGDESQEFVEVAKKTIRSVSYGVVGTAFVQGMLAALGFVAAAVPGAVLLGFVSFLLAMLQVGTALVWLPVAIWLGFEGQQGWMIFMIAWGLLINAVDNIIKPYLISQSSGLPLTLIFVGLIGGLFAWGFIGMFLGATLLAMGCAVFRVWLHGEGRSHLS